MHSGNHICQNINGIGDRTSIYPAMQILARTGDLYFYITQSAQSCRDRWNLIGYNRCVRNHDHIGSKQLLVRGTKLISLFRANLFLSLIYKLDITIQQLFFDQSPNRSYMHIELTFIITRSSCKNSSSWMNICVFYHRFKWVTLPQFHWIGWLYIIMPIE